MRLAERYLGNRDEDPDLKARLEVEGHLTVRLGDVERRRSRVRATATDGTEIGIVVGRELRDGDVLETDDCLVLVSLERVEALAIDLARVGVDGVAAALELGHALGNRHLDLAVEQGRAYVPVSDHGDDVESFVRDRLPDHARVERDSVPPTLFDDSDAPDHSHGGTGGDAHPRAPAGDHSHATGGVRDVDLGGEEQ